MKIEDQVCSLELSKKLKELGLNQRSYFWWYDNGYTYELEFMEEDIVNKKICIAAFTVADLGIMLPTQIEIEGRHYFYTQCFHKSGEFYISYEDHDFSPINRIDKSEANARAQILIQLLELNKIKKNNGDIKESHCKECGGNYRGSCYACD